MTHPLADESTRTAPNARSSDRHFKTEHLLGDLKRRSIRGGVVTISAQALRFLLQVSSTAILARLLFPSDFGLIAMATSVTGFVAMFKDAGLSMATIQRKTIDHAQITNLFWINVALSLFLGACLVALAPVVTAFYGDPRLLLVTIALASSILFGGLTVQHQALIQRQMRFGALSAIDIASLSTGLAVAAAMAAAGCGYWALIGSTIASAATNAFLVWAACDWRPGLPTRSTGTTSMLRFGGSLTAFNILNYITRNADSVIVGYLMGTASLGLYSKAYGLLMLPIRQINAPVSAVILPALSRLQHDPIRYRRAYLHAIRAISAIGMPLVAGCFVIADELVRIVLGPGWQEAATLFRWLAPAAFFGTLNIAPGWICISTGRTGLQLRWAMLSAPITLASLLIGAQFGLTGVAAAFSLSWTGLLLVFIAMACKGSPVAISDLGYSITPIAAAAVSAAGIGWLLLANLESVLDSDTTRAATTVITMIIAYPLVLALLPGGRTTLSLLTAIPLRRSLLPRDTEDK